MKRFYPLAMLTLAALSAAAVATAAPVSMLPEAGARYAGHYTINVVTGATSFQAAPASAQVLGDVYDNVHPPAVAQFGFSSTDLTAIFGDRVTTTGGGLLDQNDFSVYNSGTSAGNLETASFVISFYDGASMAFLGGYVTPVIGMGPLPPGYYVFASFTGISALSINLPTTDILVTQQVMDHTGTANRLGIVSLDPPGVGSSGPSFYVNASTVGPAGYYNINGYNANPGYRINVTNATPARTSTWGMIKALYR